MNDPWTERGNDRYRKEEFVYGKQPNNYLKEQLAKLPVGTILFQAEGEGRNAVFAGSLGWRVSAFEVSVEGRKNASHLAETRKVSIDYQVGELQTLHYNRYQFDVISLIYAHFPADMNSAYNKTR